MKVYLVRHGETSLNAARILQPPDTPLSERGVKQVERVAQRLASAGVERILTSDHVRTRATAEAIHTATGAPIEIEPLLRERNFGIHRGCAYTALEVDIFAPDYTPPEARASRNSRRASARPGRRCAPPRPERTARSRWSRTVSYAMRC